MVAVNVERMSLREIHDLEAKIAKAKSQATENAKAETKAKIDKLLDGSGFTIAELYGFKVRGRGRPKVAKYRNPDNPEDTWSGRGRKPNWLVAKLKKGAKIEQFAA